MPSPDFDLTGARILITGASSGFGAHFARLLAQRGAAVALAARRVERLDALVSEISAAGGRAEAFALDVTDADAVAETVAEAAERLGGLTGLVNNAGVAWGGRSLEMTAEEWRGVTAVNLDGVFFTAQAAAKAMAASGGGAIVNIASILALRTGHGVAAYAASKAAVAHLTKSLALEWARHNVRVNALAPGYFPTEINQDYLESEAGDVMRRTIPLRRFGEPSDLDGPLLLLLSEASRYMTGVILPVDGGHLVSPL